MVDEGMKAEVPTPGQEPVSAVTSIPKEQRVADRYLQKRGVVKPEDALSGVIDRLSELSEGQTTPLSPSEIYDLFIEREDLKEDVSRRSKEKGEAFALSLDEKKALIAEGNVKDLLSQSTDFTGDIVLKSKTRIEEITHRLDEEFAKPGVYEEVREDLAEQVRTRHHAHEVAKLHRFVDDSKEQILELAREAHVTGRSLTSMEAQTVAEYRDLTQAADGRINELMGDEQVRLQARYEELKRYQREFNTDRFVETPSRKHYVTELEALWSQGKKVLVTGATGTGKTELVRHASHRMFKRKPFEITGHEKMTPYELLGRTGMSAGQDVYRPSQLIQATTADEGQGAPFLYDEMDASPNQANIALKTLLNDGPGSVISVQMDSDKKITIGPNYSFTGTANVKSEKHQTRFEIDPAIVRILEPMIVPYMPPAEVWDIAVATLIDKHGGLPMGRQDAEKTLRDLTDAAAWTQAAYLGEKVITDEGRKSFLEARSGATTGKAASLKEAVLDPGRVVGLLKGWEGARLEGKDLRTFLGDQIVRFINNENFPEDDRYYLIEIFALKGFLNGRSVEEFKVRTGNDEGGFNQKVLESWTGGKKRESEDASLQSAYLTAGQVVRLDPYHRFGESLTQAANQLLQNDPEAIGAEAHDFEEMRRLFGDNFLGPEEVEKTFGVQIPEDEVPPINFSHEQLEWFSQNNYRLVLRHGKTSDGSPLTMERVNDLLRARIEQEGKGRPLFNTDWYRKEPFFTFHTMEAMEWVAVSNDLVPNSTNKNYLQQTELIGEYLTGEVYKGRTVPQSVLNGIQELQSQRNEIARLIAEADKSGNSKEASQKKAAEMLSELDLNQQYRQTPAEVLYDTLLYLDHTDRRLLSNQYAWTRALSSRGSLVSTGGFCQVGLGVDSGWPIYSRGNLGVALQVVSQ